jgi:hypothetical protein
MSEEVIETLFSNYGSDLFLYVALCTQASLGDWDSIAGKLTLIANHALI